MRESIACRRERGQVGDPGGARRRAPRCAHHSEPAPGLRGARPPPSSSHANASPIERGASAFGARHCPRVAHHALRRMAAGGRVVRSRRVPPPSREPPRLASGDWDETQDAAQRGGVWDARRLVGVRVEQLEQPRDDGVLVSIVSTFPCDSPSASASGDAGAERRGRAARGARRRAAATNAPRRNVAKRESPRSRWRSRVPPSGAGSPSRTPGSASGWSMLFLCSRSCSSASLSSAFTASRPRRPAERSPPPDPSSRHRRVRPAGAPVLNAAHDAHRERPAGPATSCWETLPRVASRRVARSRPRALLRIPGLEEAYRFPRGFRGARFGSAEEERLAFANDGLLLPRRRIAPVFQRPPSLPASPLLLPGARRLAASTSTAIARGACAKR